MKPPIYYRKTAGTRDEVTLGFQTFKDHKGMTERLKKTLYYGKHPKTDRPSLPLTEFAVEIFSKAVPEGLGQIDMDYASRVSRNACISPCSMILAMAYIERIRSRSPDYLTTVSSSDLFLVSMMVASKFLYDEGEDEEVFSDEWAKCANMDLKDINQLERNFLQALDWNAYMNSEVFEELLHDVEYKIASRKSRDRGWCTYTDLSLLLNTLTTAQYWNLILDSFVKVVTISSIAYVASAATMIGAMVLVQQLKLQATKLLTPSSPISNELTRLSVDDSRGGLNSFSSAHTICDPFDVHDLNMMMNESSESLNSNLWLNNEDHQSRCATSKYQLEFSQLFFPSDDQISLTKNCSSEPASLDDTSNGFGSVFNVAKSDEISDHPKSPLNNYHSKTLDIKDYKFLFPHTKFKNPTVCVATNFVFI